MSFSRTFFSFLTLLLDICSFPTGDKDIVEFTEDKKCGLWQVDAVLNPIKTPWTPGETVWQIASLRSPN